MSGDAPRYLHHNGGWWVRRDESPTVPWGSCFREMDQRLSDAVTRYLPGNPHSHTSTHTPPPGRAGR